jgi:hypothetical protein
MGALQGMQHQIGGLRVSAWQCVASFDPAAAPLQQSILSPDVRSV